MQLSVRLESTAESGILRQAIDQRAVDDLARLLHLLQIRGSPTLPMATLLLALCDRLHCCFRIVKSFFLARSAPISSSFVSFVSRRGKLNGV